MLLETLKRHWWVLVLRGVAAIIFGVIAFTHPLMAAVTLVWFFGAWVLIDGIFRVVGAIGHHASDSDWGLENHLCHFGSGTPHRSSPCDSPERKNLQRLTLGGIFRIAQMPGLEGNALFALGIGKFEAKFSCVLN